VCVREKERERERERREKNRMYLIFFGSRFIPSWSHSKLFFEDDILK